MYQISQFCIGKVILEVPGQIQILPPQPKKEQSTIGGLFLFLVMESLKQRPPEEVVGSNRAAPPVADAAALFDPQRSKNRRISVSPNGFSGTARRIKSFPRNHIGWM